MTLADDPLLAWRAAFPALESCVHLVSHSLGCVPAKAEEDLAEFYDLWQTKSITAWDAWVPEVAHAAARIERLISAPAGTVAIQPNVSAAMACVASCFEFAAPRNRVVYESLMFPSVSYVWKAEERRGAEVVVVESADGATIDADAVCAAIDERTLLVPIQHVVFSSAFIQDVKKIARRAAAVGAHVILDCYQSIGAVPIDVVDLGVAFACGGSIKYLCGGPGAGWLYVRQDLVDRFEPRATGWFANAHPFAFTMPAQTYAEGVWRYLTGTPAIAALYQSRAGQTIVAEIGVSAIREKSLALTGRAIEHVDAAGFKLTSPRAAEARGGSVVFDFVGAADVARELNRRRFFCDHRPAAGIRIAPHFYTKAEEIDLFFAELRKIRG
jgi:kynureninase